MTNKTSRSRHVQRGLVELGLFLASISNIACVYIVGILWNLEIYSFFILTIVASCLLGFLIVDLRKGLIYLYISLVLGATIATAVISSPTFFYAGNPSKNEAAITMLISSVVRLLLFSIVTCMIGLLIGCALGERAQEIRQIGIR